MPAGDDTTELDRRLAEVDALRRRVLNVIPHALRTPITTFRGLAEALAVASEQEIKEQISPALRRLAAQAEHLLDDMLIAAGYSTALPTGAAERTPVVATIRDVWAEVGGGRDLEIDGDEDLAAVAPKGSLSKIFLHVLDNAAKYGEGTTRAVVRPADGRVTVDIASGGVSPTDIKMFLEPFYRSEAAVMHSAGLGVGLTVADALVNQAGGALRVEEAPGGGVLIRIELVSAQ